MKIEILEDVSSFSFGIHEKHNDIFQIVFSTDPGFWKTEIYFTRKELENIKELITESLKS